MAKPMLFLHILKLFPKLMPEKFKYDVFLSHSSKDKDVVRELAEQLKVDGITVWFDEWIIKPGDPISLKIQQGIEKSRTLVMCMSPNFFRSEWASLEQHSLLFRDPTNQKRRFIPLLITACKPPDMIAQFAFVDWTDKNDQKYTELLNACRDVVPTKAKSTIMESDSPSEVPQAPKSMACRVFKGHKDWVAALAVSTDGERVISASADKTLRVWDLKTKKCIKIFKDHDNPVRGVVIAKDGRTVVSGASDGGLLSWDLDTGALLNRFEDHHDEILCLTLTPDGKNVVSGSDEGTLKISEISTGRCLATLATNAAPIWGVTVTPDGKKIISGSYDGAITVWDFESGPYSHIPLENSPQIEDVQITPDGTRIIAALGDATIRIWDLSLKEWIATLEGHSDPVFRLIMSPDGKQLISGGSDGLIKVWDLDSGACLTTLSGHTRAVGALGVTPNGRWIVSAGDDTTLRVWDLAHYLKANRELPSKRYTNAKIALIGESGVGKTGLAIRLVEDRWEKTDSTHGMNVWQLRLPELNTTEMDREVWLWDFAGQPDYRLIHQLFMDETALALMIIDPQRENPLEPLAHWEKALGVAVRNPPVKLLVAARCERGGFTISQSKIDAYCDKQGYKNYLSTSARAGDGCDELKIAISKYIPWDRLPWTATSKLFKTLKDAILRIKQDDIALIRFAELNQRLKMELQDELIDEADLRAVVGLLGGQGIIKPLDFGDFILLRPEEINNYASLVARSARESSDDIGCISERDVLKAKLPFPDDMKRLRAFDEEILLRAIVETFVNRSLCIREETPQGTKLVFPSYFKQERDEINEHPNVFITYGFSGVLDEIYATLVVRLHYTNDFEKEQLWKYAADFKTLTAKRAGFQMRKTTETEAQLVVYFESSVDLDAQVSFIKYIHEHLLKKARDVTRVRSYICPHCSEPLENLKAVKVRLERGEKDIACSFCEKRVVLVDMIEEKFASNEFRRTVQRMDKIAQINLDNESLELILVGHAFTIAGEAGHIFRPTPNSDWGIDGEIEFKNDRAQASGQRVYLQLKSGDSYLRPRKRDEKEIFYIKNPRWAEYWQAQQYPVMLVIRTSDGRIRWMNVTEYLQGKDEEAKQIVFEGEPFTALNVSRMRDKLLPIKR